MWLLDANMDVHLAAVLVELGIRCDTAGKRGWKALSNGDLVATAAAAVFAACSLETSSSVNRRLVR